jgi:hypothetical protein
LLLAVFGKLRIVLQEATFVRLIPVLGHIRREDGLAVLHVPGVFRHQMTGPALRGDRIGHTIIERAYVREVLAWIQSPMNMTALTILHNDEVVFFRRQLTLESFVKRSRLASGET